MLLAVGLLPAQLRRMLRWEALAASAVGALAGMAAGCATAAIGVPLLGSADALRLEIPAGRLLLLAALATAASGLLALGSIARTLRISPGEAAAA